MKLTYLLALPLCLLAGNAAAQSPRPTHIKPPVLQNRSAILAEKTRIAQSVLKRGDSLYIRVYTYVDPRGVPQMPEIKTPSGNVDADSAAVQLVRKMVFAPAPKGQKGVLLTIPVVFVRK